MKCFYILPLVFVLLTSNAILASEPQRFDPIDEAMGERWLKPNIPPPRREAYKTPNIALMDNDKLWRLINRADPEQHRVLVAMKVQGANRGFFRGKALVSDATALKYKRALVRSIPGLQERPENATIRSSNGEKLPIFSASLKNSAALAELRKSPLVDYVEPAIIPMDALACGFEAYNEASDPRAQDSKWIDPNGPNPGGFSDTIPYSYGHHSVQKAWGRFSAFMPGYQQGIAVLDSGVSSNQEQFFTFYSSRDFRPPHIRINETVDSIDDECFHGTKVASIAAAPRDGRSVVGIAWNAPLITVKIVHSPLKLDNSVGSICDGIFDAIKSRGDRPPIVRVVAMAFGLTYASPTITECIETAFMRSPSTIFVAAAGSIVSEVVFPANLKPYVVAVSMVEITPDGPGYRLMSRPLTVSYGPEVDFVSVSTANGIPASGRVGNDRVDEIARFRYSSAATGIYAGLIAVAGQYATQRGWSRAQLVAALRQSASRSQIRDFSGEPLELVVGSGIVNLYRATGGAENVVINAPYQTAPGQQIQLKAETDAIVPPGATVPSHFNYRWFINGAQIGGSTDSASFTVPNSGPLDVKVFVTDTVDGNKLEASHQIRVTPTPSPDQTIRLFWSSYVADWATFLNGGRHDRDVNPGVSMPTGCLVQGVSGILMCRVNGAIVPCAGATPKVTEKIGTAVGFTVSRPPGLKPNDLETIVHQWHDGASIVRTKVVYDIFQPAGADCLVPGVLTTSP
jgi:serine protease